jgi:hypothetical protein
MLFNRIGALVDQGATRYQRPEGEDQKREEGIKEGYLIKVSIALFAHHFSASVFALIGAMNVLLNRLRKG